MPITPDGSLTCGELRRMASAVQAVSEACSAPAGVGLRARFGMGRGLRRGNQLTCYTAL